MPVKVRSYPYVLVKTNMPAKGIFLFVIRLIFHIPKELLSSFLFLSSLSSFSSLSSLSSLSLSFLFFSPYLFFSLFLSTCCNRLLAVSKRMEESKEDARLAATQPFLNLNRMVTPPFKLVSLKIRSGEILAMQMLELL